MAVRIDGKALAAQVKARAAEAAKDLPRRPGLAVILVGNDPASRVYVNGKERDCAECGFLRASSTPCRRTPPRRRCSPSSRS